MTGFLKSQIIFFALLTVGVAAHGAIELGVGLSSATSGRHVPAIAAAFGSGDWVLTGTSTGTKSAYYYYSNYSISWMRVWSAGDFIWGELSAGFGAGAFMSKREFVDEGATLQESGSDFGLGPAFRVKWFFASPVYMNMEVIWGLRSLSRHLTLNGQDLVTFSVGVEI